MLALELIKESRAYLDYLEDHIINVRMAWIELQTKCKDMRFLQDDYTYNWIASEVIEHDLSKFSEFEFVQYRRQFYPSFFEQREGFKDAWLHHKEKNPHHWENWIHKDSSNPQEWEVHCVHMIIDWMAMSYRSGVSAQEYYENNKEKIKLPYHAVTLIYEIFKRIKKE